MLASTSLASADPNPSRANAEKPWAMVHVSAPECGANAFRVNAFLHLLDVELMGERLRTTKDDDAGRSVELTVTIDGAVCDAMSRDLAIRLRWSDADAELKRFIDLGDIAVGSRERALALAVAEQIGQTRSKAVHAPRSAEADFSGSLPPPSEAASDGAAAREPTSQEPAARPGPDLAVEGMWRAFFSPKTSLLGANAALSLPAVSTWLRWQTDVTALVSDFTDPLGNVSLSYLAVGVAALAATRGNPAFLAGPHVEVGRATVSSRATTSPVTPTDGHHPIVLASVMARARLSIDAHWAAVLVLEVGGAPVGVTVLADDRTLGGLRGTFASVCAGAALSF